jgi:pimeloyl-ACP methyl ester carboxylesterase
MRFGPPAQFARRPDGHNLAYQVVGDAPLDLVLLFGWPTHLGLLWENPSLAGFLYKLASFSRLILVDRLGNGLSDRGPAGQTFEDELDDVRLVLDAVASRRAAFFGCHIGGRLALLFAATYPERTRAVVTFASHPATLPADDYPWGSTPEQREGLLAAIERGPPDPAGLLPRVAPRESADPSFRHWWRMFYQSATTAPEAYDMVASLGPVDIRRLLGSVRVPALLLHRTEDQWVEVRASRYMAERMPDARLVELPGDDHFPFLGDQDAVVVLAQEFLTGARPVSDPDRVLATVLFTDIVDSPGWPPSWATSAGTGCWRNTTRWCAPTWPASAAARSRPPVTASWPPSTGPPARSGPPMPSAPSWPSTAWRSGSVSTPASASCSAMTSAGSPSTSPPGSSPRPGRGRSGVRAR